MSERVRAQYEAFPYPARTPADERKRLIVGSPSHILEINHYLFAGRRDFTRPFRALFAGGGTGDGAIMLAQQLADLGAPAEIVHLDPSRAAQETAAARARIRGLTTIRFQSGAIEELDGLGLGSFDYIDCCGVLHHLEDPPSALARLAGALAPGGGIGLMVYGALGRIGVYHAQEMLRLLDGEAAEPHPARLDRARRLLKQLPRTNWLARNPFVGDHLQGGDAGLHDLLLHARDRAYTVPELDRLAASAGLGILALIEPARYEPGSYLTDPSLLERARRLDPVRRAALAELLAGDLKVHIAYLAPPDRAARSRAEIAPDLIAILREANGSALARALNPGDPLKISFGATSLSFPLPRRAPAILAQIDGRRTVGALRAAVAEAGLALSEPDFDRDFAALYRVLTGVNQLFLADRPLIAEREAASAGRPERI